MELFKRRFPHYELVAHPERGTVLFQHDDKTTYSPEELIAMILQVAIILNIVSMMAEPSVLEFSTQLMAHTFIPSLSAACGKDRRGLLGAEGAGRRGHRAGLLQSGEEVESYEFY